MDDEWVLLSEIEHWSYCPRQWAIIHLEQYFSDNDDTVRGHIAHERVDAAGKDSRANQTTFWALDVASDRHRIRGRCDRVVCESGSYVPIEHKSGRKTLRAAVLQLVGQAMCLEEMIGDPVREGRLYLAATNATEIVDVADDALRSEVLDIATAVRTARKQGPLLPVPANDNRCPACSLREACMPVLVSSPNTQRGLHGATWWP